MEGNHLWRRLLLLLLLLVRQFVGGAYWTTANVEICHLPVHTLPIGKVLTSCTIVVQDIDITIDIDIVVHERAMVRQV